MASQAANLQGQSDAMLAISTGKHKLKGVTNMVSFKDVDRLWWTHSSVCSLGDK